MRREVCNYPWLAHEWTVTIDSGVIRRDASKYFHFTGLGCVL